MSTPPSAPLRDVPPHLDQQVNHPVESAPLADTTAGGTSMFVSARSNSAPVVPSDTIDSRSPGELMASPNRPSGLRVKLRMDANGCHYMLEEATGMRFDFSDDESIPTHTPYYAPPTPYRHPNARVHSTPQTDTHLSPSEASDLLMSTESGTQRPTPEEPPERILEALVDELSAQLNPEQRSAYSTIHTMLTTGRAALLTTTAFVVNQRTKLKETTDAVDQVREDTNKRLLALHAQVEDQEEAMERCLSDNVRVLHNFGSTETHLEQLTQAMLDIGSQSPKSTIPPLMRGGSRTSTPLGEFQDEINAALEPQRHHESDEQYHRRSAAAVRRADRTAAAFPPQGGYEQSAPVPSASAAHFAKTARFEDVGSISTAPIRSFQRYLGENSGERGNHVPAASEFSHAVSAFTTRTVGAKQLPFFHEKETIICAIVEREVGHRVVLPPGMRFPKSESPPKFEGVDDLDTFIQWVELLCSFMSGYLIYGYEDGVDAYRINITKGHLSGAALDWFVLNISKTQVAGRYPMGFADVLCALLGRFITSMNAQRATRSFDAVRFDNVKGPEAFAELLITRANQMHNIPEEFVVRQRFLGGLPSAIRYKMRVDRELSAEYSSLEELRTTARHFWSTMRADEIAGAPSSRDASATPKAAIAMPARRPPPSHRLPTPAAPPAAAPARATLPSAPPRTARPGEDTRTCYKCGIFGHIGTNPICPQFNEKSVGPATGVRAQRVLESYAEGENSPDDELFEEQGENNGDSEGLWAGGGAQYEPSDDEETAELGPDLADLGDDARVGAMQARYYALRIPEPESDEDESEFVDAEESVDGPDYRPIGHEIALLDLANRRVVVQHGEYPIWTAEEEDRLARADIPGAPASYLLLNSFEARFGAAPLSVAQTLELESINALGSEERAQETWSQIRTLLPGLRLGCPAAMMRTMAFNTEFHARDLVDHIRTLLASRGDITELVHRRMDAAQNLDRLSALPTGSNTRVSTNLITAATMNQRLTSELRGNLAHLETRLTRARLSAEAIDDEILRRTSEREAFTLALRLEQVAIPQPRGDEVSDTVLPSSASSLSPPTSTAASTPPPSYPGSPDSESSVALWDGVPDDTAEMSAVFTLEEGNGDITVWIDSDSGEESPEVEVRAQRLDEGSPLFTNGSHNESLRVNDTYEYDDGSESSPPLTNGFYGDDPRVNGTYEADDGGDSEREEIMAPRVLDTYEHEPGVVTDSDSGLDRNPIPGEPPQLILRSIVMMGALGVEQIETFLDSDGNLFSRAGPLPEFHPANPDFRRELEAAIETAVTERATELHLPRDEVRRMFTFEERWDTGHWHNDRFIGRHGILDTEPRLFPGTVYHERLASHGPDDDDENAFPGDRVQILTQKVSPTTPAPEHLSNIRRPEATKTVGLLDQPKRSRNNMACLSAMLKVGTSTAYFLFDSGSNTDSITPEYAHATGSPRIQLAEQIVLQLGCIGSRSKISYGTCTPIDFGGIRGHLYLDQVNLDRYDGIIGTPFMNKHGVILDFGKREIRFPSGKTIPALSALEEASVLATRRAPLPRIITPTQN